MQFYAVNTYPKGDADTCFHEEKGYNQGDASLCPVCGAAVSLLAWLPPLRVVLELYGKEFGDFAFTGSDDFLVSQKFKDLYYQHDLRGLVGLEPVEVIRAKSRRKNLPQPPAYFRVSARCGQTALDLAASGVEWVDPPTCSLCRTGTIKRWKRLVLEAGTWTGDDAFRPRGLNGTIMVSQRFKDACERHGIKNAHFIPAEIAGHDFYPWEHTARSNGTQ